METSWAVFLGGLGLGSVATSIVQHILARSAKKADTLVNERKEAFTGYLAALAKINENDHSRENLANYGLWVARVQLVAAPGVSQAIEASGILLQRSLSGQKQLTAFLMKCVRTLAINSLRFLTKKGER